MLVTGSENDESNSCFPILKSHPAILSGLGLGVGIGIGLRMSIRQRSEGLQDLLTQLAHFCRANETIISAEHVSKCLEHLPAIERCALDRLFILLHQNKVGYPHPVIRFIHANEQLTFRH